MTKSAPRDLMETFRYIAGRANAALAHEHDAAFIATAAADIATAVRVMVEADHAGMWRPISEAPKDGDILVGWHDGARWRYAIGWREKFTRAPEFEFATHFYLLPEGLTT